MLRKIALGLLLVTLLSLPYREATSGLRSQSQTQDAVALGSLEKRFGATIQPFFERYCFSCHGPKKRKGQLDLSRETTLRGMQRDFVLWERVLERLHAKEMPPEDAPKMPTAKERAAVVAWLREVQDREAERTAGDPGPVLARRLSNAEFDYTIHD